MNVAMHLSTQRMNCVHQHGTPHDSMPYRHMPSGGGGGGDGAALAVSEERKSLSKRQTIVSGGFQPRPAVANSILKG